MYAPQGQPVDIGWRFIDGVSIDAILTTLLVYDMPDNSISTFNVIAVATDQNITGLSVYARWSFKRIGGITTKFGETIDMHKIENFELTATVDTDNRIIVQGKGKDGSVSNWKLYYTPLIGV